MGSAGDQLREFQFKAAEEAAEISTPEAKSSLQDRRAEESKGVFRSRRTSA